MRIAILFLAALSITSLFGCDNRDSARNSTSNSGDGRSSLASPDPPRNGVDGNGNATVASNSGPGNTAASQNDALRNNFWMMAAQGGLAEVELSKVAQTKSTNAEVKSFARMMVTDHARANNELKSIAQKKNLTLPTTMSTGNQDTLVEMNRLTGADFDKEYVTAMLDNHEADVQLFEGQSADDSDPEAKAFAAKTLPTLRKHLETIRSIRDRLQ